MPGWNNSKDYFHLPSLIIVEYYEWLSKLINVLNRFFLFSYL